MRRLFLAVLFVLIAVPAGAVSTTSLQLTTTWQSLGSGPLQVQTNNQSQTLYQISDSAPAAGSGGFFLQGNSAPQIIQTTSQVWVRVRNAGSGPVPVVLYAPVAVATANGSGGGSTTVNSKPTTAAGAYAAPATVNTSSTQVLPAAANGRTFMDLKNESTSQSIACNVNGGTAALNTAGSFTIAPGGDVRWEGSFVPADQVNCITSAGTAPLTIGAY